MLGFARLIAMAAVVALVGCARDPFDASLTYAIPSTFEAASDSKAAPLSEWWRRFGSEELNQYVVAASVNNFDVAVAVASLDQAEAQAGIAHAALFPMIGFASNASRTRSSGTDVPGVISKGQTRNSFSPLFNASYILDVWGQNRDQLDSALHNRNASAYQVEVVRLTTQAAVVNSFLQYAANYERVAVAKENLGDAERVLKIIKQRQAAGTAAELDTAQQESLVATQRAAIPALRLTAETSRTALALLLGRPPQGFELNTKTTRSLRFPDVLPGLPSSLLFRRPDVRAAEQQLEAQDADVQVARKAFLPTIQLTGDAGFQSAALATLLRPESFIWSIAAGVTQPIFEGGRLVEQLALSEAQRQQLLETYRKSIIQALTDVENALIGIRENSAREVAQRQVVSAARQALDLTKQRLDAGTIDTTTLLNAQIALFQAQDSLVQVRLARLQAIVSLFQALGGDWSEG